MKLIEKIDGVFVVSEKILKTIKKSQVINKKLWNLQDDELNVYIAPSNSQELSDAMDNKYDAIRIGITENGDVYFWNGDVLHSAVAQALGVGDFLARLTKLKKEKFFNMSTSEMGDIKQFKKYILPDKDFLKGVEILKKLFPTGQYIKLDKDTIEI